MNPIIATAGLAYRAINRLRRALYRRGVLRAKQLGKKVISVGNIVAGGAGKTPAVIAIARHLTGKGYKVAILTRGYGRSGGGGLVTSLDADRYGDEPALMKKSVPEADVIVGVNRYLMASEYLALYSCDVILLDDGFQHLQLHRDLDIVIDTPSELHREGRSALRHAGVVIPRRLRLSIPAAVRGKRLFAFAGLADNDQFFSSLRDSALNVAGSRGFPDHHRYTPADLEAIEDDARAAKADLIVTTEKDSVKLVRDDIVAIPAEFVMDQEVLDRIEALIRR